MATMLSNEMRLALSDRLQLRLSDDGAHFLAEIYCERGNDPSVVIAELRAALLLCDNHPTLRATVRKALSHAENGDYIPTLQTTRAAQSQCTLRDVAQHINRAVSELMYKPWRGVASSIARSTFISDIPERKKLDGNDHWQLAGTDLTARVIEKYWPREQIVFDDSAEDLLDMLLLQEQLQDVNVLNTAKWELEKAVPKHAYDLHPLKPLSGYQQLALVNSLNGDGFGLFMKQGTGKTPIVIARVCNEAKNLDRVYRAIVVCPNNVRANWAEEFKQFATIPGKCTVIRGGALERRKQLVDAFTFEGHEKYTIVIISYDSLVRAWEDVQMIPWDLAVGDESHYFKTPTTRRFKYMMRLRDIAAARMPLTGTPITNNHLDLYAQWEFMGPGYSGFYSHKAFKNHFGEFAKGHNGDEILESIRNLPEIKDRLARTSFQITLEEALPDLPEKVYDVYEVEMTPRQAEIYDQVRKTLILEIEETINSGRPKAMVIQNVLTMLLRLAQITSGFIVWDPVVTDDGEIISPRETEDIAGGNPKLEALVEIAANKKPTDKTLIWATFTHDIKNIAKTLRAHGHDVVEFYGQTNDKQREEAEWRYNCDPACRFFVGNAAAGGTGINLLGYDHRDESGNPDALLTNTTQIIYYSQNWSSVQRDQSEARGHRRKTREHVRVTDLCIPNTIDEQIRTRVMAKIMNAMQISDVTSLLKSVLGVSL